MPRGKKMVYAVSIVIAANCGWSGDYKNDKKDGVAREYAAGKAIYGMTVNFTDDVKQW